MDAPGVIGPMDRNERCFEASWSLYGSTVEAESEEEESELRSWSDGAYA
jgi:hypothetical protein